MVKESARKIKQDNTTQIMILVNRDNKQSNIFWRIEQFVVHTNQRILDSSTGMFTGLLLGIGNRPDRHLVLYYWLVPNRNA